MNGWFVIANWLFYFLIYVSKHEAGIIDGFGFLLGILLEVPSGALSDLLGKRKMLILGFGFQVIAVIFFIYFTSFYGFLIGALALFTGFSFISGTYEAFGYDSLKEVGKEKDYSKIVSKAESLTLLTATVTTILGGLMYKVNPVLPWYAWGVFSLIALWISFKTREPKVDTEVFSLKTFIKQQKKGFHVFWEKENRSLFLIFILFSGLLGLTTGITRQSIGIYLGFSGSNYAYVISFGMIIGTFVLWKFSEFIKNHSKIKTLLFLQFSFLVVFCGLLGLKGLLVGSGLIIIFNLTNSLFNPLRAIFLQPIIPSEYRATTISTVNMIAQIPYIIFAFFFVGITEPDQIYKLFIFFICAFVALGLFTYWHRGELVEKKN